MFNLDINKIIHNTVDPVLNILKDIHIEIKKIRIGIDSLNSHFTSKNICTTEKPVVHK